MKTLIPLDLSVHKIGVVHYTAFSNTNCALFTLQFGGLEALITGICDEWPRTIGRKRELFVACLIVYCFFGGLATTTYVSRL